jgi:hypothetical protein
MSKLKQWMLNAMQEEADGKLDRFIRKPLGSNFLCSIKERKFVDQFLKKECSESGY